MLPVVVPCCCQQATGTAREKSHINHCFSANVGTGHITRTAGSTEQMACSISDIYSTFTVSAMVLCRQWPYPVAGSKPPVPLQKKLPISRNFLPTVGTASVVENAGYIERTACSVSNNYSTVAEAATVLCYQQLYPTTGRDVPVPLESVAHKTLFLCCC